MKKTMIALVLVVMSYCWLLADMPCKIKIIRVEKLSEEVSDVGLVILDDKIQIPIREAKGVDFVPAFRPLKFKRGFFNIREEQDENLISVGFYGHANPIEFITKRMKANGYVLDNKELTWRDGRSALYYFSIILKDGKKVGTLSIFNFKDTQCREWYIVNYEIVEEIGKV